MENDLILTDDKDIAKTMNNFFINTTKSLNFKPCKDSSLTDINETLTIYKDKTDKIIFPKHNYQGF